MDMYSFNVDAAGREIIIKSLGGQLRILQEQILSGDESSEIHALHAQVDQLMRGMLYTKALKKEGQNPSQELPN